MTREDVAAHQRKHGFPIPLEEFVERGQKAQAAVDAVIEKPKKLRGLPPKMNATEREFSVLLKAQKSRGDILDFCFQGVRLAWGDCMVYKPDFTVRRLDSGIVLIEVKGPHIYDRDIVRFKGCRAEWKEWFQFQMWQRDANKQWNLLL